ncbi:MAG: HAD-IB family phosphatase [Planctomycetes bacterium]|nr:HAD-IB family phosphatase [Planctomycetota bacterium]
MPAYDLVFFDCDSTLSSIEGIDELATRAGVDVSELTNAAMDGHLPMEDVYRKRLEMIRPVDDDFKWLGDLYISTAMPDAKSVITKLQSCKIAVHIVSGGLLPGILPFASHLGISPECVHAVPYDCDNPEPSYSHPLANNGGKELIVEQVATGLNIPRDRRLLIGDGVSDLEASCVVGQFVGFGGVVEREAVKSAATQYIGDGLLEPLLDIVLQ